MKTRCLPRWMFLALSFGVGCSSQGEEDPTGESPAALSQAQVTLLELRRPPGPTFMNERIPVVLGITAQSEDPSEIAQAFVPVLISFVDADDPDNEDTSCASNGFDLELVGDGTEHIYDVSIWPISECAGLIGKTAVLKVEIDAFSDTGISAEPMVLSAAQAGEPANAACRGPNPGCVHELDLVFGPFGVDGRGEPDVVYVDLVPESGVAVKPRDVSALEDPENPEDLQPMVRVQSQLLMNGRHPYEVPFDPATLPAELVEAEPNIEEELRSGLSQEGVGTLDDLPGEVRLRYALSPVSDQQEWLPLTVDTDGGRGPEVAITELTPGIPNDFTHDLYLEGETLNAVEGRWAGEDRFIVRGCFTTNFVQLRQPPAEGECRSAEVLLIEATDGTESGLVSLSLQQVRKFEHGNKRVKAVATFSTLNTLDTTKIAAEGEAELRLRGKIGRRYNIQIFKASGSLEVGLDTDGEEEEEEEGNGSGNNNGGGNSGGGNSGGGNSGGGRDDRERDLDRIPDGIQEIDVRVFGIDVLSKRSEGDEIEEDDPFTFKRSVRIVRARFGFGPIGLSFDFNVGGEAGLNAEANLGIFDGENLCRPHLPAQDPSADLRTCVTLNTRIEPFVALTAEAFGGINRRRIKAGVAVELTIARFGLPLDSALALGVDTVNRNFIFASVKQRLTFQPLAGKVKLVGSIRIFRRKRSRSITIVSFSTRERSTTLFSRELPEAELLEL